MHCAGGTDKKTENKKKLKRKETKKLLSLASRNELERGSLFKNFTSPYRLLFLLIITSSSTSIIFIIIITVTKVHLKSST